MGLCPTPDIFLNRADLHLLIQMPTLVCTINCVALNSHQRIFFLQWSETIPESHNWSKCRDQVIVECPPLINMFTKHPPYLRIEEHHRRDLGRL